MAGWSGKAPPEALERLVYPRLGLRGASTVLGPAYGEDSAVVDLGFGLLVAHSDPITAASRLAGWLAVHVACNDVAVSGGEPRWLLPVVLLPEGAGGELLSEVARQIHEAAMEVGAEVVGGHTEAAPGLGRLIVSMTALGVAGPWGPVSTGGAKPGDVIVMTKTAAVEGTAVLATDYRTELEEAGVPRAVLERAAGFIRRISVVREALELAWAGLATAMHDPTEGGVLGGASEIAHASGVTVVLHEDQIPVAPETVEVARPLGVDPLRLLASGSLLAAVPRGRVGEALAVLESAGAEARIVGEIREPGSAGPGAVLVRRDGSVETIPRHVPDEIYQLPPPRAEVS